MRVRRQPEDKTLHRFSVPSGVIAKQSVKVPPVSAEKCHMRSLLSVITSSFKQELCDYKGLNCQNGLRVISSRC